METHTLTTRFPIPPSRSACLALTVRKNEGLGLLPIGIAHRTEGRLLRVAGRSRENELARPAGTSGWRVRPATRNASLRVATS